MVKPLRGMKQQASFVCASSGHSSALTHSPSVLQQLDAPTPRLESAARRAARASSYVCHSQQQHDS